MPELDRLLLEYGESFARRDGRLLVISLAMVVASFAVAFAAHSIWWLFLLVPYAIGVVLWSRDWHKRHAVQCPNCGASLSPVHERFEQPINSIPSIACPKCHMIVAEGLA